MARAALCCLVVLLAALTATSALALGVGQEFNRAYDSFHALRKDSAKAKYRAEWEKVLRGFAQVYRQDPEGSYAPKALYYHARVYEEIGLRSGWKSDFEKAVDYFDRVVGRFPRHAWADDCLYRAAEIRQNRLHQPAAAYADLLTIVKSYPNGDMAPKARAELARHDAAQAAQVVARPAPASASPAAEEPAAQEPGAAAEEPEHSDLVAAPDRIADPDNVAHLDLVRYLSSDEYTRVVFDLDAKVQYYYKFLDPLPDQGKGHRVYIDLKNTRIGGDVPRNVTISDGILRGYRAAQNDPTTTRVVLDLLDYQEHKVFHLENPFRLVIDVYAPGNAAPETHEGGTHGGDVALEKRDAKPGVPPRDVDPGDLIEVLGLKVKTVMLDAGHGGKDPGAHHNGLREKDVNLKVTLMLGKLLEEKGYNVLYTRTKDVFVPLEDRAAMANMKKADLFISLHCNANNKSAIRGLETYSLSLKSSSEAAKRVAARENGVQPHQISDSQLIITELMLNSKMEESSDLAAMIQRTVVKKMPDKYGIKDHGRRQAPFYVLMGAKMPAVLVELGYTTNATEAKYLKSDTYLTHLAKGIASGIEAYREHIERYAQN
ncbi:MAG: N-acetylmuramoyl-L-alanine amidase [Desulfovibrionaceae bacterium]